MIRLSALACLIAAPVFADVPKVLTDIPPVHSLTAMVMGDLGQPQLLLAPGVSPHDFSFRPSDAQALADAQVVIWVGQGLTPWLEDPVTTLASGAQVVELSDLPGWTALPLRTDAAFTDTVHEDEAGHTDEHGAGADSHAWLDPDIAAVWLTAIADQLAVADPENARTYQANAQAAQTELAALQADLDQALTPVRGKTYVTPHDAFQYFETAFDMPAAGAIALGDAASPGPARIAEIRTQILQGGITCVLTDTQTNPDWIALVTEGTDTRTAPIDDIGAGLDPGPGLYPALLRRIGASLVACLE